MNMNKYIKNINQSKISNKLKTRTENKLFMKFNRFVNIFKWVRNTWYPSYDISSYMCQIEIIERWIRTKGPEWTIKRIKFLRLSLSRILAETPLERQKYLAYHGKSIIPKFLNNDLLDKRDIGHIRLQYTLLELSKIIDHWGKPNYSSITELPTSTSEISGDELADIYKKYFYTDLTPEFKEFHYSVKSGPLGSAVCSSIGEINILEDDLYENIAILGGDLLRQKMDNCKSLFSQVPYQSLDQTYVKYPKDFENSKNNEYLRKISLVKDPEMKLRPIAIFDYWSQASLKDLHHRSFDALRKFSQDCTFNHNHAKPSNDNFCFDLTAATDRFPLKIQVEFLSSVIGPEKANAWKEVLVSSKFRTPDGKSISYETGQPMGAYSSWAIFTICHHLIVQLSAKELNIPLPFKEYYLLGDDIVIQNSQVASVYLRKLQSLGVEISEEKTIKSKNFMEFAKRHWYNGIEVTPFHIGAVIDTYKSWIRMYSYWNNMSSQGWVLPNNRIDDTKQLLVLLGDHKAYAKRKSRNIRSLQLLTAGLKEYPKGNFHFNELLQIANFPVSCNHKQSVAQEYILEVIGSLKLQTIIDALIDEVKNINTEVNTFVKFLSSHTCVSQDDIGNIPAIDVLIRRSKDLMEETQGAGELAEEGFINLARKEFVLLPNPTKVISLRPVDVTQTLPVRTFINRLFQFLRKEKKEIEDAYR
jgi:hypothetical protein